MQPPRPRRHRQKLPGARLTYLLVLYVGPLILALLLVRLALDLAAESPDRFARVLMRLTAPISWVNLHTLSLPPPIADLAVLIVLGAIWVVLLGVARGWESESRRYRRVPHLDRP